MVIEKNNNNSSSNNNIKFLLSVGVLLLLIGGYLLLFASDFYEGEVIFETIDEYNAYLVTFDREPITPDEFSPPVSVNIRTTAPRGQYFPYGEKQAVKTVIGLSCLAVGVIALAFMGMELGKQKNSIKS